jgi:integrase
VPTLEELFKDTLTYYEANGKQSYAYHSQSRWQKNMVRFWGRVDADSVTTAMQDSYRASRRKSGAAPSSINREMMLITKMFKLAYHAEPPRVKRLPRILLYPENNARMIFIKSEELGRLRAAAGEGTWIRCLIELAYLYGWRRGELLRLCPSNVNVAEGYLRIGKCKREPGREVALTKKAADLLRPFMEGKGPDEPLFPRLWIFEREWHRVKKAAGCDHLKFHDFRRTSARAKRNLGVDQGTIMKMSGWKTDSMFRRYAIVDLQDQKNALDKMEALG